MRALNYVQNGPADTSHKYLPHALGVPELRTAALERIGDVDVDTLAQIIRTKRDPAFVPKAVLLWAESGGWRTAESRLKQLVIPLAPILSSSDLDKIADAFSSNSEISDAAGTADGLLELLENSQNPKQAEAAWAQIYNMLNNHEYYAEGRGANLREALETRFGFTSASE